jgi:hypothetical protein
MSNENVVFAGAHGDTEAAHADPQTAYLRVSAKWLIGRQIFQSCSHAVAYPKRRSRCVASSCCIPSTA